MNKTIVAIVIATLISLIGCGEDEYINSIPSDPADPTIEVSTTPELPGDYAVGEAIEFSILLTTEQTIGIINFEISKNNQLLVQEEVFETGQETFNYTYITSWDDTQPTATPITFTLTDALGKTVATTETINVSVEYGYLNDRLIPVPGFNLVNNVQVNPDADPINVDMVRQLLPEGGNEYFSLSTTEYYPLSGALDFLEPNITTAQIEAAISGSTPITSFMDANGLAFPIVAKLRGKNEYALIGQYDSSFNSLSLVYRKRSADAGQ